MHPYRTILRQPQTRMMTKSADWRDYPFVNKLTKFVYIGLTDDNLTLQVEGTLQEISVPQTYLFESDDSQWGVKKARIAPGYAATVDFFQGQEVGVTTTTLLQRQNKL